MGRVMRELANLPEADLDAVPEGVFLSYESGTVFVRPSADQPEMHVSVETKSLNDLARLEEEAHQRLRRLIS
jgi:phosphomannomutase